MVDARASSFPTADLRHCGDGRETQLIPAPSRDQIPTGRRRQDETHVLCAGARCAAATSAALRGANARLHERATRGSRLRRRGQIASVRFAVSFGEAIGRFSSTFQRHLGGARLGLRRQFGVA